MPYKENRELPKSVQEHLPKHAQDIYREAYNHAFQEYKNPKKRRNPEEDLEVIAHKVAWSAVKRKYEKGNNGDWYLKEEKSDS